MIRFTRRDARAGDHAPVVQLDQRYGTIFLSVCLYRAYRGDFTPCRHFGFEAAAWFWHFVDVVWLFLFLFVSIYVWGNRGFAVE